MRCLPGSKLLPGLFCFALLAGAIMPDSLSAADWFNFSKDKNKNKGKVIQADARGDTRGQVELVSFASRTGCGCRGCCLKHNWAPYYCGLDTYHRPFYGEPGWRGFWKAEGCCGLWRKHDMSCYNCPPQNGSW